MRLLEKERRIVQRLMIVPEVGERLAIIESIGAAFRAKPKGVIEATISIPECSSDLHVVVTTMKDRISLYPEASSTFVRGMARVVCSVFDGEPIVDVIGYQTNILSATGIWGELSTVRQLGMSGLLTRLENCFTDLRVLTQRRVTTSKMS